MDKLHQYKLNVLKCMNLLDTLHTEKIKEVVMYVKEGKLNVDYETEELRMGMIFDMKRISNVYV